MFLPYSFCVSSLPPSHGSFGAASQALGINLWAVFLGDKDRSEVQGHVKIRNPKSEIRIGSPFCDLWDLLWLTVFFNFAVFALQSVQITQFREDFLCNCKTSSYVLWLRLRRAVFSALFAVKSLPGLIRSKSATEDGQGSQSKKYDWPRTQSTRI
jgi:hypothetical protein